MKRPLDRLRLIVAEIVAREEGSSIRRDLSTRQLAVLTTIYCSPEALTVRRLSSVLGLNKPAISRAIDRLTEFEFVTRRTDPTDGRSVLIGRTLGGSKYIRELESIIQKAEPPRYQPQTQPEVAQ